MKVTGIITEYNPFHRGHEYHIEKARELTSCDVLIAVMSGNFVQRGEPAIYDKWQRSKEAIKHGCDLVLELPFIYATQSADQFAQGAMKTLQLAGAQQLVFGSESADLDLLKQYASQPMNPISTYMDAGKSAPSAYGDLYEQLNPNDILGVNYIRYASLYHIEPLLIKRTNQYHNEKLDQSIASATAIRKAIKMNIDVQHQTPMDTSLSYHTLEEYYPYIQTMLLTLPLSYLKQLFLMDEGIESLFVKAATTCMELSTFLDMCISRRYTRARIKRTLIHLLHQTTKITVNELPALEHIRVLACNQRGQAYLKSIKNTTLVASRFNQIPDIYRQMELKTCHVFAYPLSQSQKNDCFKQELQPPIILDV